MKRTVKRFLRAILIVGTISVLAYRIIYNMDHHTLSSSSANIVLGIITFFVLMAVFLIDQKMSVKYQSWLSYLPSFIGFFLVLILSCGIFYMNERDKSPSVLYGLGKVNTFVSLSIDFRKDKTYKISCWDLGSDFYRGRYEFTSDSTITIDRTIEEKGVLSTNLLIRTLTKGNDSIKVIYQMSPNGNVLDKYVRFNVINKDLNE